MSRKSRTILHLSVKLPVPPGVTQAQAITDAYAALQRISTVPGRSAAYSTTEILVKLERKEITYF